MLVVVLVIVLDLMLVVVLFILPHRYAPIKDIHNSVDATCSSIPSSQGMA